MKTKKFDKKLSLKKNTIADLDGSEMNNLLGGVTTDTFTTDTISMYITCAKFCSRNTCGSYDTRCTDC
jgi:natural product precursor